MPSCWQRCWCHPCSRLNENEAGKQQVKQSQIKDHLYLYNIYHIPTLPHHIHQRYYICVVQLLWIAFELLQRIPMVFRNSFLVHRRSRKRVGVSRYTCIKHYLKRHQNNVRLGTELTGGVFAWHVWGSGLNSQYHPKCDDWQIDKTERLCVCDGMTSRILIVLLIQENSSPS